VRQVGFTLQSVCCILLCFCFGDSNEKAVVVREELTVIANGAPFLRVGREGKLSKPTLLSFDLRNTEGLSSVNRLSTEESPNSQRAEIFIGRCSDTFPSSFLASSSFLCSHASFGSRSNQFSFVRMKQKSWVCLTVIPCASCFYALSPMNRNSKSLPA